MNIDEVVWYQKYRPKTIAECILPTATKAIFEKFAKQKTLPDLLLVGSAGVGKSTVAQALMNEIGCDYLFLNASLHRNVETLRNTLGQYATTLSITNEGRKYVILDEADYLNAESVMPPLRGMMEEYSQNCGWILTCNFANKIIEPIHSRCALVDFSISSAERMNMMTSTIKRLCQILEAEKIKFDVKAVAALVKERFPDLRRMLNELQKYSASGMIDAGILGGLTDNSLESLIGHLKAKKFDPMRDWVTANHDLDFALFIDQLYKTLIERLEPRTIPQLIMTLSEYDNKNAFVANKEINMVAMLLEIMNGTQFKN